ncbi:unnamed protein product [Boreogadus saida]
MLGSNPIGNASIHLCSCDIHHHTTFVVQIPPTNETLEHGPHVIYFNSIQYGGFVWLMFSSGSPTRLRPTGHIHAHEPARECS